jgi:hypothetical protein
VFRDFFSNSNMVFNFCTPLVERVVRQYLATCPWGIGPEDGCFASVSSPESSGWWCMDFVSCRKDGGAWSVDGARIYVLGVSVAGNERTSSLHNNVIRVQTMSRSVACLLSRELAG